MDQEHLLQVASYLDRNYFSGKESSPRRGYATTNAAWEHAVGILYPRNEKHRIGSESSLSGNLAEPMFASLLTELSPAGYIVKTTGKKADGSHGCDITVSCGGKTIGGFALKTGQASYDGRRASRITEYPVINFLMEHLGSKDIIEFLKQGIFPDMQEMVRLRLGDENGRQMREQLYDQLRRHMSIPKSAFRDYLEVIVEKVAQLNAFPMVT